MRANKTTLAFLVSLAIALSGVIVVLAAFNEALTDSADEIRVAAISCAYLMAPYLMLGLLAFAFRRALMSASVAVLIGSLGVVSVGIWVLIDVLFLNQANAMAAVPLLFLPLWQLLGVGLTWLIARSIAEPKRTSDQRCANCGYKLRGLRSSRCPECGTLISPRK